MLEHGFNFGIDFTWEGDEFLFQKFYPPTNNSFIEFYNVVGIVDVVDERVQSNPKMIDSIVLQAVDENLCDFIFP